MSDFRKIFLNVNPALGAVVDPSNPAEPSNSEVINPTVFFAETVVFCISFIDSTGQPVPLLTADTFELSVDCDFVHGTDPLMAFSGSDSVNISGDWDDADSQLGKISIRTNFATEAFLAKLDGKESKASWIEIKKYTASGNPSVMLLSRLKAKNVIHADEGEPVSSDPDFYTSAQVDALLNAGFTVQFVTAAGDVPTETETATAHTTQSATDTHYRYRNASTPNGDWTTWIRMIPGAQGQPGGQGSDGTDGTNGATFTPSVDSAGDLSWTNDGGLTNPTTVNIKGPQGNAGTNGANGITPHIDTTTKHWFIGDTDTGINAESSIASVLTIGANGNWYIDGTDTGVQAQGQTGIAGVDGSNGTDGTDGATFTPAVDSAGNLSWTNDGGLTNPDTVNIKGVQGDAGADGQFTNGVAPVSFTSADLTNSVLTKTFTQLGVAGTNPLVLQIVDNSGVIQDASSGVSVTWSATGVSIDLSGITGGVSGTWKLIFGGGSDASVLGDINAILDNINGEVL